jgi:GNAT superfamily N-acetyltransferase
MNIVLTDAPDASDVGLISAGLDEFNVSKAGFNDRRPLAVLVRDPDTNQVVGGLVGRTSLGLLFVDTLHLPAELRGSGIGSEILRQAEDEARRRGCHTGVLYTINFQAPGFYQRNGWRPFGEVPSGGDQAGIFRVFMTKTLQ